MYRPYKGYRKQRNKKIVTGIFLLIFTVILLTFAYLFANMDTILSLALNPPEVEGTADLEEDDFTEVPPVVTVPEVETVIPPVVVHEDLHAIYIESFTDSVSEIDFTNFNAVVLDLKLSSGQLTFETFIESIQSSTNLYAAGYESFRDNLTLLPEDIKLVGRINAYFDPVATKVLSNSYIVTTTNVAWLNHDMKAHLDPSKDIVNEYLLAVCLEAQNMGFDEVILYNYCFPNTGQQTLIDYSHLSSDKTTILEKNLQYLNDNLDIAVSLEISDDLTKGENALSGFSLTGLSADNIYYHAESLSDYEAEVILLNPYLTDKTLIPYINDSTSLTQYIITE